MTERVLILCEKPSVAKKLAYALNDRDSPKKIEDQGIPYYLTHHDHKDLIFVSALGHLFSIAQKEGKWTYPVFKYEWVPSHEIEKRGSKKKKFLEIIEKLSKEADSYISACDYDMEGSLIAYMILRHVCNKESLERAKRMRYSNLTHLELKRAWNEMSEQLDFPLIEAGKSRHEVDWLFGINLSRALTLSLRNSTGIYKTLSIGRVQGPTLNIIKKREGTIKAFVPKPFWVIKANTKIDEKQYSLEYEKPKIEDSTEAKEILNKCTGKKGVVISQDDVEQYIRPPPAFNLGDLQREAYNRYRYSLKTTTRAGEKLYLEALISYPRTSSHRLPKSIDLKKILLGLKKQKEYSKYVAQLLKKPKLTPQQGEKDDPAHPAIHPTGNIPKKLKKVEMRIFDLICRRFLGALGEAAIKKNTVVKIDVDKQIFYIKGSRILKMGWTDLQSNYFKHKELLLPKLKIGMEINLSKVRSEKKFTKPPPRLNEASLLKILEDERIGTKSTRSEIIETLYKRGYIQGRKIEITKLGMTIIDAIEDIVPEIISVEMTRNLEENLMKIQTGEKEADIVVSETIEFLRPILKEFKSKEATIGKKINESIRI